MHRLFAHRFFKPLVVGCLLCMPLASLQAQPMLTVEEAVQEVLKNNKTLQQARNRRKIAAYNHHIGKTDFFPTLILPSITANWPKSDWGHNMRKGYALSDHTWFNNEIGLGWKLKPSSIFSYQTLRTRDQISELEWQQKMAAQVGATIKAYYSLVLAQQKQKMGMNNLVIAKETLQLAEAQHELGQATGLDYLDAQVTYERAEAAFRKQEENIANQKRELGRLLGRDEFTAFHVVEEIPLPESLDWESLLASYKTESTALLLAQKQHKNSIDTLRLKQVDQLFPSLGLDLTYACWEKEPQYRIGLTLDFTNIFQYVINAPQEQLEAENYRLDLADTHIDEEEKLRSQFLAYTQQLQDYTLQQRSVQVSQARAAEALEKYRLGSITLLDLKRKQEEAQGATKRCLEMCYQIKEKETELRAMAGMSLVNEGL